MRKIVLIAGLVTLAACSKPAEAPAAVESSAAAVADASAAASESPAGDYTFVDKDKKAGKVSIAADNTYTVTWPDGTSQKGVVAQKDGKACYDPEGDKDPTMCWTNGKPAEDGTWVATNDDGVAVTVTRVAK
jgi:hypothetical protein